MAASLLSIRKRIKSIKNTRQVTKAMEAVAGSKMRKAVDKAVASREYATMASQLIQNLAVHGAVLEHPLTQTVDSKRILALLVTSDRGLCGAFNAQIIRTGLRFAEQNGFDNVDFVCLGRKGELALKRFGRAYLASFSHIDKPSAANVLPISQFLVEEYKKKRYGQVVIMFTDFQSRVKQQPVVKQLLPLSQDIALLVGPEQVQKIKKPVIEREIEYLFEPNGTAVVNAIFPRLVETQVYQTILESLASEHVSRMFAMRNATDNASEIIEDLTLTYNQARQADITQEIAEISAGKAALEG